MPDIDYTLLEKVKAEPDACSMIETFRAVGYSIEAAVADIIDNSITAGALNIWIDYDWKGPKTVLSILDDGCGMSNNELINAMRPGCKNPLDTRADDDLGRFGLGLKTASFSQTRKFTVISKQNNLKSCLWSWDLDFVNKSKSWSLVRYCPDENYWLENMDKLSSGTCVVWWELDRLTKGTKEDNEASKCKFLIIMEQVKKHLSMVFHRFIDKGINIFFRNRKIEPWEPFMIDYDGLQPKPETLFQDGRISIKGFVLPHRSKLNSEAYNYGKGPKDSWTAHQGFYIYRSNRLLVSGDWLGLFKRELHYDLCRIQINLPNDVDDDWQIDIKKSIARLPLKYKEQILSIAKEVRNQAVEVYRHRGKVLKRKLSNDDYCPFWEERERHGKRFYKINRMHPLITELYTKSSDLKSDLEKVLQFIEETVPVPLITFQEDEKPHGQPFEGKEHDALIDTIKDMYQNLIKKGKTDEQAKLYILNIEPFNFYPQYIEQLKEVR